MAQHGDPPRVFVHEDTMFGKRPLSKIVEDAGCALLWGLGVNDLAESLENAAAPIDLIVVSVHPDARTLDAVAEVRKRKRFAEIPILAIGDLGDRDLDLWQLRALGVTGVIDADVESDHVRFRIAQIAYKGRDGRRFERAPCCVSVELEVAGEWIEAYTTSLSVGGLGIASRRRISPNTLVRIRLALSEGSEPVEVSGRTVHIRRAHRSDAEYEIGLFFYRLSDELYVEISRTVARLLAAWDAVGGMDLVRGADAPVEIVDS